MRLGAGRVREWRVQEQPALGSLPLPETESRSKGALEGRAGRMQAVRSGQMEDGRGYMPKVTNSYFKGHDLNPVLTLEAHSPFLPLSDS